MTVEHTEPRTVVGNDDGDATIRARVTELGVKVRDLTSGRVYVPLDFPWRANRVREAGGVSDWFHPFPCDICGKQGRVEEAGAKFGQVIDRGEEAT